MHKMKEILQKEDSMRRGIIYQIKANIVETKEKIDAWEARFLTALNLHEKDVAFVMLNCYRNRLASLYEKLELELI